MAEKLIKLIKNAEVYSPEYLGRKDILISSNKIAVVADSLSLSGSSFDYEELDFKGKTIIPGLIDQHVHITGGGGEAGFATRIFPMSPDRLAFGGVTAVLGLIGTDGTTRSVADLYANACRLSQSGISSYILTGSYEVPTITLTGSVKKDIVFIDKVIGVKTAISDHRASYMTYEILARLASDARTAGMIGGKAGIVTIHMGDADDMLNLVYKVLEKTAIPVKHFVPTHLNRNPKLMEESVKFGKMGGFLDYSAIPLNDIVKEISAGEAVRYALSKGVPEHLITMSSDGNGSWSNYDEDGNLVKIGASDPQDLFNELRHLIKNTDIKPDIAIKTVTSNPARVLGLFPQKGVIRENSDADMVILDSDFKIESVIANGRFLIDSGVYKPLRPSQIF